MLRVGAAVRKLSATDEMAVGGGLGPTPAAGQDGDLRVVATVVKAGDPGDRLTLVAADVVKLSRHELDDAARRIELATGVPFSNVLITCTHTHHAPITLDGHGYKGDEAFTGHVIDQILGAATDAHADLAGSGELDLRFKMGEESTVGENSRRESGDGAISWLLDGTEEQWTPTGPFDPAFPVLEFGSAPASPKALLFGHSTHAIGTRVEGRRSPAFYGLAAQRYERERGAVTTYLAGAVGSTHMWRMEGARSEDAGSEAECRILDALRRTVAEADVVEVADVGALRREVSCQVREFDEAAEERAVSAYCRARLGDDEGEKVAAMFRAARADLAPRMGAERPTWLSALHIGDVALVGVPGELFAVLGLEIKRRSPFPHTVICGFANDHVGYIGDSDSYDLGGYQIWTGVHSWVPRGFGESLVDEATAALAELWSRRTARAAAGEHG